MVQLEYIADEQAAGYYTSILEEGLAKLRAKLGKAQGHHDVAAEILEECAGFDEEGNVTDAELGRDSNSCYNLVQHRLPNCGFRDLFRILAFMAGPHSYTPDPKEVNPWQSQRAPPGGSSGA